MRRPVQELFGDYQNNLYAAAFNVCKNAEDAKDVVQDTFIQYYSLKKDFDSEQHIRAWLFRVAINRAKNMNRTFWRRNKKSLEDYMETLVFETTESEELFETVMKLPNATFEFDSDGNYVISYPLEDGTMGERGGGGIVYERDGSERPLTEDEVLESLNDPEVVNEDDGKVWVYYYDQKIEITDQFEDGVCYVEVSNGDKTLYMTIKYKDGWCSSPHKYQSPAFFN